MREGKGWREVRDKTEEVTRWMACNCADGGEKSEREGELNKGRKNERREGDRCNGERKSEEQRVSEEQYAN